MILCVVDIRVCEFLLLGITIDDFYLHLVHRVLIQTSVCVIYKRKTQMSELSQLLILDALIRFVTLPFDIYSFPGSYYLFNNS